MIIQYLKKKHAMNVIIKMDFICNKIEILNDASCIEYVIIVKNKGTLFQFPFAKNKNVEFNFICICYSTAYFCEVLF